jgi:hypothetical protein
MALETLRIAGAILILLTVLEALFRKTLRFLPIGGNHVAQLGIVFGLAFVLCEVASMVQP